MSHKNSIWRHIKNFKFKSLFIRNFVLIFLLIALPIGGIASYFYRNTVDMINEEMSLVSRNSLNRIRDIVDSIFDDAIRMATKISMESDVQLFMLSESADKYDYDEIRNITDKIDSYSLVFEHIDSIYIYSEINDYVLSNLGNNALEKFSDDMWYAKYTANSNNDPWIQARRYNNRYPYYITIGKPTGLTYDKNGVGAIVININAEELGKIFMTGDNPVTEYIYILDDQGIILYNNDLTKITTSMMDHGIFESDKQLEENIFSERVIDGEKYFVLSVASNAHDNRYVSLIPYAVFEDRLTNMRVGMALLIFICMIVSLIVSYIISVKTFSPVQRIMSFLDDPDASGNSALLSDNRSGGEVQYITDKIIRMVYLNNDLRIELDRRMSLMKSVQSTALQAQINPHFLYNTLELINWKAIRLTKGKNDVSKMLTMLSNLLRLSTDIDGQLTTIEKEIEHAKLYGEILKMRYADKIELIWDIERNILEQQIIVLTLQPIIENAVYHGIKPRRMSGVIKIHGKLTECNHILILISDNGIGITKDKLDCLNQSMKEDVVFDNEHIGLMNVNQRIKMAFGKTYGIRIASTVRSGTSVFIEIPYKE